MGCSLQHFILFAAGFSSAASSHAVISKTYMTAGKSRYKSYHDLFSPLSVPCTSVIQCEDGCQSERETHVFQKSPDQVLQRLIARVKIFIGARRRTRPTRST